MTFGPPSVSPTVLCVIATLWSAAPLAAQESRVTAVEQEITEKAQRLEPYEPGTIEAIMLFVETNPLIRRIWAGGDTWYPRFGGLPTGSGIAIGPGYRTSFWLRRQVRHLRRRQPEILPGGPDQPQPGATELSP